VVAHTPCFKTHSANVTCERPPRRWFIVTTTPKDLDEAMKQIHPGPASVDKMDLWVITPLGPQKR
jgi:hypothetical protein